MKDFKQKYMKYKTKYLGLKVQKGGCPDGKHGNNTTKQVQNCYPNELVKKRLDLIRQVDFEGFNKRNYALVRQIYDENIYARPGDGMEMKGIDAFMKMMTMGEQSMPDAKILSHEVEMGSGDYTTVAATMAGTFTGPMLGSDGKIYQPNGKRFKVKYCVVSKWRDMKVIEEYNYWETTIEKALGIQK